MKFLLFIGSVLAGTTVTAEEYAGHVRKILQEFKATDTYEKLQIVAQKLVVDVTGLKHSHVEGLQDEVVLQLSNIDLDLKRKVEQFTEEKQKLPTNNSSELQKLKKKVTDVAEQGRIIVDSLMDVVVKCLKAAPNIKQIFSTNAYETVKELEAIFESAEELVIEPEKYRNIVTAAVNEIYVFSSQIQGCKLEIQLVDAVKKAQLARVEQLGKSKVEQLKTDHVKGLQVKVKEAVAIVNNIWKVFVAAFKKKKEDLTNPRDLKELEELVNKIAAAARKSVDLLVKISKEIQTADSKQREVENPYEQVEALEAIFPKPETTSSSSFLKYFFIALAAIAVIGGGAFFLLRKN